MGAESLVHDLGQRDGRDVEDETGRQRETEPQNQKRRDCCDLSLPQTEPSSTLARYLPSSN